MWIPLPVDNTLENLLKFNLIDETVVFGIQNCEKLHYVFKAARVWNLKEVYSKQELVFWNLPSLEEVEESEGGVFGIEHHPDFLLEIV